MSDLLSFQVERFAELMVRIDDPFGSREAVFAAAALDEDGYRSLVDAWRTRFERDASGGLASRFADAYAAGRAVFLEARRRKDGDEPQAEDTRFLNADAQSFREDAARVAREPLGESAAPPLVEAARVAPAAAAARFAGTTDIGEAVRAAPRVSLPFVPAPTSAPAPAASPARLHVASGTTDISAAVPRELLPFGVDRHLAEVAAPSGVARAPAHLAGTADISAFVPRAATPFAAPAARRRLIRFDPQTGQPLPAPLWVDLPPEPQEPGAPKK